MIGTYLLEVLEEVGVDKTLGALVQRSVDGDDIALRDKVLQVLDAARANLGRRICSIEIMSA